MGRAARLFAGDERPILPLWLRARVAPTRDELDNRARTADPAQCRLWAAFLSLQHPFTT